MSGTFVISLREWQRLLSHLGAKPHKLTGKLISQMLPNGRVRIQNEPLRERITTATLSARGLEIPRTLIQDWTESEFIIQPFSFKEFRVLRGGETPPKETNIKCHRQSNGRIFITAKTMHDMRYRFRGMNFSIERSNHNYLTVRMLA